MRMLIVALAAASLTACAGGEDELANEVTAEKDEDDGEVKWAEGALSARNAGSGNGSGDEFNGAGTANQFQDDADRPTGSQPRMNDPITREDNADIGAGESGFSGDDNIGTGGDDEGGDTPEDESAPSEAQ